MSVISISAYFSQEFLFTSRMPILTRGDKVMMGAFIVMFILAIIFRLLQYLLKDHIVQARFYSRLFTGLLAFSLVGGLWSGVRYLEVPYMGIRFVASLIYLGFVVWLGFILKYAVFNFGKESSAWSQEQLRMKYIKGK